MWGGVRIRGGVGIRQSGSDFNEGMHNLAGVQISAQHLSPSPLKGGGLGRDLRPLPNKYILSGPAPAHDIHVVSRSRT